MKNDKSKSAYPGDDRNALQRYLTSRGYNVWEIIQFSSEALGVFETEMKLSGQFSDKDVSTEREV